MRTTKSDPSRVRSQRFVIALLGLAIALATSSGCSTSSSPGPTTAPPTTTVLTPTSAPATSVSTTAAPVPTGTVGAPPSISVPPPPIPIPVSPPSVTQPGTPSSPPSTPNPNPPSGTTFAGEGLTDAQANAEQQAVDAGHQPWRLDTVMVAKAFVQGRFGWTDVQTSTGAPMVVFVTNSDGSKVTLHLIQPATKGDKGIWEVDGGVWD